MAEAGADRKDFAPWSHGVTIPLPQEIAAQFPAIEGRTPHVTLLHAEWAAPEQTAQILEIVEDESSAILGETITLGDLGYFDQFDQRVSFAHVDVSAGLRAAREQIVKRVAALDIDVSRMGEEWVPHATITMVPVGQDYVGTVPAGSFAIDEIRVQRGDEWRTVTAPEMADEPRDDAVQQPLFTAEDLAWVRAQRAASAPAVHTESRNLIEIVRADRADLGEALQVHQANGWRRYPVLYSRAENVQEYPGPNGTTVREYRPADVVFSQESMDSGVGAPWELRHSADLLTPETVRGVAVGTALTVEQHTDGIHTAGIAQAWGRDLFEAIDHNDARDLSVAFNVKVDPRPGTTDLGQSFDQRVVRLLWNSLASEPKGRAGTARVLTPRADATDGTWVSRADALLDIAARATPPTRPIYFDLSSWVRADSTRQRNDQTTHKDAPMDLLKMMMAAAGMSPADLAAKMGAAEDDVAAMLGGEVEMTEEQMVMVTEALMPRGETDASADTPAAAGEDDPAMDAGDTDLVKGLKSLLEAATSRADAATRRAEKAEAIAAQRKDSMDDMIPRADAIKLAEAQAIVAGDAMELARRALGNEWSPTARKDAADADLPITLRDWQCGAIEAAFGEKAEAIIARIDAAPDAARPTLLLERVSDAREILDTAAHTSKQVIAGIARVREANAQERQDADSTPDSLAAAKNAQRNLASGKPQPNSTQGAA